MKASKRDFDAVAIMLAAEYELARGNDDAEHAASLNRIAFGLNDIFKANNPAFNERKFLEAAGVIEPAAKKF